MLEVHSDRGGAGGGVIPLCSGAASQTGARGGDVLVVVTVASRASGASLVRP